jgi:peptidoglycan/xylan/chitin deacetylase (PgdA/CDA1 family)
MTQGPTTPGTLILSLDFELFWGILDKHVLSNKKQYLINTREKAIPGILERFKDYEIHATWATVGMLFCEGKEELLDAMPAKRPNYIHPALNAYHYLQSNTLGKSEEEDPFHFAPSLIKQILATPQQEIGSHTFSHYYCLEEGQDVDTFRADLSAAQSLARKFGIKLQSLVFPRNQYNPDYLAVCQDLGFQSVRGNAPVWIWKPEQRLKEGTGKRLLRLADSYGNIYGHHSYKHPQSIHGVMDIAASHLLRPYAASLDFLESQKVQRICKDLNYAATHGQVYHLWWHPHNFGTHTQKNLENLQRILDCYASLKAKGRMQSMHMHDAYQYFYDGDAG